VLLFLLGHVVAVESSDDAVQAEALDVLLQWLRCDAQQAKLFDAHHGVVMLKDVLASARGRAGRRTAAVLLNASCSGAVLTVAGSASGHVRIAIRSQAVVVDPRLLGLALESWRHWQRNAADDGSTTLDLVLRTLQHLLRDDHPQRQFNVRQMQRGRVLDLLLQMAKQSTVLDESRPLTSRQTDQVCLYHTRMEYEQRNSPRIHLQVADLVEGLLESPPAASAMAAIVEYLLLMQPAALTYAANAASNYSFLLSARNHSSPGQLFQARTWQLPVGCETHAGEQPHSPDEMNNVRLTAALSGVQLKWASDLLPNSKSPRPDPKTHCAYTVSFHVPEASGEADKSEEHQDTSDGWQMVSPQYVQYSRTAQGQRADLSLSRHLLRILTACVRVLPDSMVKQVGRYRRPEPEILSRNKKTFWNSIR